ncbi:MAG: folylpolyglutamate synthase/dihydrofolate synthase family protein [Bryobacteraceae bacterium]
MNYPDSVHFLYALGNEIKTAKLGLERIRAVLGALGNAQDRLSIVHVAGTNGKGSTCAMIESGFRAAGLRTGLYTSPHLAEPTERIRIDGRPVSAERFAAAFDRVHATVEQLLARDAIDLHTTYFETVTAMAFVIFAEEGVERVVLEVGLGGRLDATNVVQPSLAVITPIDFDHESFLGRSIESIATEKAGILKPGVPAVFARQRPEAARVLDGRAAELGVPVTRAVNSPLQHLSLDARGSRFEISGDRPLAIRCPLAGEHQAENAVTAALALLACGIDRRSIEAGIAAAVWPGRLEHVRERPTIILDGAHNPAAARALAAYIGRFYAHSPLRLIFGIMRDKAAAEIAGILFPLAWQVIVTAPRQSRALAPESLRAVADHPNLQVAATLEAALRLIGNASPDDVIFVTGSLFLVAEARALLVPGG